jgi:hypothetical protein
MGNPDDRDEPTLAEQAQEALASLAAEGLIYDSGRRRNGQIVWVCTPGKEGEIKRFLTETGTLE